MKALTVRQPHAERIAAGRKRIENRTLPTKYRGWLLIHAGKSQAWIDARCIADSPHMAFSAIVAVVNLAACVRLRELPFELQHDPYANGPFCWLLERAQRLTTPVPCSGAQGLWVPPAAVLTAVLAQVHLEVPA